MRVRTGRVRQDVKWEQSHSRLGRWPAFSPSLGPPPHASTGGPSPGERMAALCGHPRIDGIGSHWPVLLTQAL